MKRIGYIAFIPQYPMPSFIWEVKHFHYWFTDRRNKSVQYIKVNRLAAVDSNSSTVQRKKQSEPRRVAFILGTSARAA